MYDGPNLEAENCLPGVVSALSLSCCALLLQFSIHVNSLLYQNNNNNNVKITMPP